MKNLRIWHFIQGEICLGEINSHPPQKSMSMASKLCLQGGIWLARSLAYFLNSSVPLGTRLDVLQHDTRKYFTPNIVYFQWYSDTRLLDIINLQTRHCENPNFRNLTSRRQTFATFCRDIIFDIKKPWWFQIDISKIVHFHCANV